MSKDTSSTLPSSQAEDTPLTRTKTSSLSEHEETDSTKQIKKKGSEAQKLQQDTNIDNNILQSGSRLLRSHKTLISSDEDAEVRSNLNMQGS